MDKIPKHVLTNSKTDSSREWKSKKRKQIRAVIRAIDDLRSGCAYFPNGSDDVDTATNAMERIKDDCSVKNWGR